MAAGDLGSTGGHTETCKDPSGVAAPQSDEILLGTPCLTPCRQGCLAPLTSDTQLSGFSRQGLEQGKDFSKQEPGFPLVLLSLQSRKTAGLGTPRGPAAPSCRLPSLSPGEAGSIRGGVLLLMGTQTLTLSFPPGCSFRHVHTSSLTAGERKPLESLS